MKVLVKKDSIDYTLDIFVADASSTTGAGLAGLVFNSSSLTCYYRRGATGAATQLALVTQTVGGAHTDGGFVEISAANMPGWYRLDLSDAIIAAVAGGKVSLHLKGATNMAPLPIEIQLVSFDPEDAVGLGLSRLDATVSSRATQTSVDTIDDFVDTEVAAIKAKTDNLPADPADASDLLALLTVLQADTDDLQARLPAALTANGNLKTDVQRINGSATAAAQLALSAGTIVSGAAAAGTLSTTQMTTNLTEATDDHYQGRVIIWTSGVLVNQATDITAYAGATKMLTYSATTEAPSNGDTFVIV